MPHSAALPAIQLAFDPIVEIAGRNVRLETLALAAAILAALLLAARIAHRTPVDPGRGPEATDPATGDGNRLRRDDLLYIVVAALPGAVLGGRLGYVLIHLDYYAANPGAIPDPAQGSLALTLAVVGGTLTATIVGGLLGAPVGRWLHALTLPLLFALGAGKAAMVLGGDGQGIPVDLPWATAYLGPGPWGSLAPDVPSHPAQAYEAIAVGAVLLVVAAVIADGGFRRLDATAFFTAIALWAGVRVGVAFTWRDPAVLGPLGTDQLVAIVVGVASLAGVAALEIRARRRAAPAGGAGPGGSDDPGGASGLRWPDPAERPRF